MQALLRHVNFDVIKCVLVASPGFVKDQFLEYVLAQALKTDNKVLLENKGKFLLVHASSGFKHSLREVLADPTVTAKLADTKAAGEVRALEAFYATLQTEPDKAFYGLKQVEKANEAQGIQVLLISDALFRGCDVPTRRRYVNLIEGVRDSGGEVKIFSSLHVSGERKLIFFIQHVDRPIWSVKLTNLFFCNRTGTVDRGGSDFEISYA